MIEYISKAEAAAIRRALGKLIMESMEAALSGWEGKTLAAVQTGDAVAVRAVLEAMRDDLDKSVERLVAAARAEIDALPGVVIPDAD